MSAGKLLEGTELLGEIVRFAEDKKAIDVVELDLRGVLGYTENDAATVHNVVSKEVPAPSSRGPKIPDAFDAIVLRALDRDQSKRFDSALEMADALRKAATQANLLGSRQGVARWVTTTFAEGPVRNKALSVYTAFGASGFAGICCIPF